MNQKIIKLALVYSVMQTVFFNTPAFAYVDPGSGSVIVTTVLGLIAAVTYTFRKFFYNLRAKFFGTQNHEKHRSIAGENLLYLLPAITHKRPRCLSGKHRRDRRHPRLLLSG